MSNRVVLVTGAGGGIGRATALAFARAGDSVVATDIDAATGSTTVDMLKDLGAEALFVAADVTNGEQVAAVVDAAVNTFGRLDVAVNNAGIAGPAASAPLHEYDRGAWDSVLGTNLTGVWLCMKHEIAVMLGAGGGAIVNTASFAGIRGGPGRCAYIASKHGVVGLTRAAAIEYGGQGIRVNAVCPGPILTPLLREVIGDNPGSEAKYVGAIPAGRLGNPDEVAEAVLFLTNPAAAFVNGTMLSIDGGQSA